MDKRLCVRDKLLYFFFAVALSLSHSIAFANNAIANQLRSLIADSLSHSLTPGVVLLVSSPQIGTIIVASGLADQKTKQFMEANNNFRIASMSKTFLAVTILKLVEAKQLSLDDKIAPLLPDSIDINRIANAREATIRQLLQMRSGIPNYVDYDAYYELIDKMTGKKWTSELCISIIYDKKPNFAPDKSYEYSNTNYLLLQLIVEKLTGHPYGVAIRQQILTPLHLKNTFVEIEESNSLNHLNTHGYRVNKKHLIDVTNLDDGLGLGDSGMISTVADINQFIQALLKEKTLLSETSLKEMLHPKDDYGLGIYPEEINDTWAWSHNGLSSGFQGQYYYFPREKLSIVFLTNNFDTDLIETLIPKIVKFLTLFNRKPTRFLERLSHKDSLRVTT